MTQPDAVPRPFVRLPFPKEESIAELYHENTKLHPHQLWGEADPTGATIDFGDPASLAYAPPQDRVALPPPDARPDSGMTVEQALRTRRSRRGFTGGAVPLADLSKLLHLTYGLTGATEPTGSPGRAAPSAGGRFPLEWFVVAQRVDGLAPGLYHYHPETHALETVETRDVSAEVHDALLNQPLLPDASFLLVAGAAFSRTTTKYGDRGYRLVLLDAGHAMQNAYLAATTMGLGLTALGGFLDDKLNALLRLNGEDENVVYCAAVGTLP